MRLLVTCLMACALLVAAMCQAQIVVSDQVPPPVQYPFEVYGMTDAQFFVWATTRNQTLLEAWQKRKAAIKESEYITGTETVTTSDFGGCDNRPLDYYDCGSGNNLYFGLQNGYAGSIRRNTVVFPRRWANPWYIGPGPLTIINPYVRPIR